MRLRIFSADTVAAAMTKVRTELGADAMIVNIENGGRGRPVRITAAIESAPAPLPVTHAAAPDHIESLDDLATVLRYHGAPAPVVKKLMQCARAHADIDVGTALSLALDQTMGFRPIDLTRATRLILVGLPGHGKTLNTARLVAQARQARRAARVITFDSAAAGALAQLEAFCAPFDAVVSAVEDPWALPSVLATPFDGVTLIDTAGVNPYALADIENLARAIARAEAEPIWVLGAGLDAMEAAELSEVFASLGVRRMIASRIDASRRLAAIVCAALRSGLPLAGFSASPFLGDPIDPAQPGDLARLLLTKPEPLHLARIKERLAS
jgi:flagellar biosynthesis protein FlhF